MSRPVQRHNHPYKIWRDEVARQMGHKPPLGTRRPGAAAAIAGGAP